MAKISKCQEEYIQANWKTLSISQLVEDTGVSVKTVTERVKNLRITEPEDVSIPDVPPEKQVKKRKDTMFMKSIAKNKQALVMTEGGAQMGDDFKKTKKKKNLSCVHKPLGEN